MPVKSVDHDPERARRFRELAAAYLDDVLRWRAISCADAADADDAVQESDLRRLKLFTLSGPTIRPWLCRDPRNVCHAEFARRAGGVPSSPPRSPPSPPPPLPPPRSRARASSVSWFAACFFGKHSYGTPKEWLEESRKKRARFCPPRSTCKARGSEEKLPGVPLAFFIFAARPGEPERRLARRGVRIPMKRFCARLARRGTRLRCFGNTTILCDRTRTWRGGRRKRRLRIRPAARTSATAAGTGGKISGIILGGKTDMTCA